MNSKAPRICMPTWRAFTRMAFQCGLYEAQDVLVEADDVDLIHLEPGRFFKLREQWQRRLVWKDFTRTLARCNPGLKPVHLKKDYDLFLAVCQNSWDLLYINAIKGWKDHCRTSLIWFDELWAAQVPGYRNWLETLARFDHVVLGLHGSIDTVSKVLGRTCHWGPGGVDTLRFTPFPHPPERVVDVYSMGRRWPGVHRALLDLGRRRPLFYLHDTFSGSDARPPDHREHRNMLANVAKRSKLFMVGPAKMDAMEETRGQVELGYRYFEGSASGAVMLGQVPDCEAFRDQFGWSGAVAEIQKDGSDTLDVVEALLDRPEEMEAMGRRNARESLLRHDWMYRWKHLLEVAGLQPAPGMVAREKQLRELAEMAAPALKT